MEPGTIVLKENEHETTPPALQTTSLEVSPDGSIWFALADQYLARLYPEGETTPAYCKTFFRKDYPYVHRYRGYPRLKVLPNGDLWAIGEGASLRVVNGEFLKLEPDGHRGAYTPVPGQVWVDGNTEPALYSTNPHTQQALPPGAELMKGFLHETPGALWSLKNSVRRFDVSGRVRRFARDLRYCGTDRHQSEWYQTPDGRIVEMQDRGRTVVDHGHPVLGQTAGLVVLGNGVALTASYHDGVVVLAAYAKGQWLQESAPETFELIRPELMLTVHEKGNAVISVLNVFNNDIHPWRAAAVTFSAETGKFSWDKYVGDESFRGMIAGVHQRGDDLWFYGGYINERSQNRLVARQWRRDSVSLNARSMCEYRGETWIAANGRLGTYDENGLQNRSVGRFPQLKKTQHLFADGDFLFAVTPTMIYVFDGAGWTPLDLVKLDGKLAAARFEAIDITPSGEWRINTTQGCILIQPPVKTINVALTDPSTRFSDAVGVSFRWNAQQSTSLKDGTTLQYSWQIDDQPWTAYSGENNAWLPRLTAGKHTFRLRIRDSWFNLSPDLQHEFIVLPPVWQRPWFVVMTSGGTLLILLLSFRLGTERTKRLLVQERMEAEKQHALDQYKLKVFTNVSHEFRTPLTMILSPVEKLLAVAGKVKPDELVRDLNFVQRNGKRLMELVNQLMTFRKLDAQRLSLELTRADLIAFLRDLTSSFTPGAEDRNVKLEFSASVPVLQAWFDPDKLEKMLGNLIGNALKFTPEGGCIRVGMAVNENRLQLTVEDNGPGIPEADRERIFDRFFQCENQAPGGTGVGLALVKELSVLCGGDVHVENADPGCRFVIDIPLLEEAPDDAMPSVEPQIEPVSPDVSDDESEPLDIGEGALVLVAEDTEDIREFLAGELGGDYRVLSYADGVSALEAAQEFQPDLVLADVMMPKMDGVELCHTLKETPSTSHIPVILLTALGAEEHQIRGLAAGADDYVPKPFNLNVLKARICTQLANRRKLRAIFKNDVVVKPAAITTTSLDEQFMQQVIESVEMHIDEPDYNADVMAEELIISRSGLYGKIKAITGLSVNGFISSIRLKYASQLLLEGHLTPTMVSERVGFSGHSYFCKCFKKEFGMTPTQYVTEKSG